MRKKRNWNFNWLKTWDEIWNVEFVAQWQNWVDGSTNAHVYFEPSMVRAWVSYYQTLEKVEPRFMIAEHGSGCKVFFPLVCVRYGWKDAWYRVLQPPGSGAFDYHDPIFTERYDREICASFWDAFVNEITERCARTYDEIVIPRVQESCVGTYGGFFEYSKSPFVNLRAITCVDALLSNISRKLRRDIQRQVKRLEKLGDIQLRVYNKDELDLAMGALDGLIHAYCAKWRTTEKVGNYWKQMLLACLSEEFFHISVLESRGVPISWHIGFLHKGRFYHYKLAFDMRFATYSPGKVHRMKLIEESLRQQAHMFDFLRGEEAYKYHWTKSSIVLYQLRIKMSGLRSWGTRNARRILWANRNMFRGLRKRLT